MFRIGEFAQIAQISSRMLRHYDQLGLLRPGHTDAQTGYRYYSTAQLGRLHRILALKDLGLTLEQIGPLLDGEISPEEMRGMLTMKRAQVEQTLRAEELRLKQIESRIAQLDREGVTEAYDVVVKSIAALPYLAAQKRCETMDEAFRTVGLIANEGARQIRPGLRDRLIVLSKPTGEGEEVDLSIGFSLTRQSNISLRIDSDLTLTMSELPAIETMATIVREGPDYQSHFAFGALGQWIEANGFAIDGPCREVFLDPPTQAATEPIVEIQYPVRRAA